MSRVALPVVTPVIGLALKSLRARLAAVLLAVLSIAVSVALLMSVSAVRDGARASFAGTISGTDVIIGARSGDVQLLLYAVFRLGNATNNLTWESYEDIAAHPAVEWAAPISLGDSHRGFRVMGVTQAYFQHYRYRGDRALKIDQGAPLFDLYDAVIGADVARALGYSAGDKIVVAHGLGAAAFREHQDKPFTVAGVLEKTGTPVDRTVHVSLEAIEAIHIDWRKGAPVPGISITAEETRQLDLKPKAVTAALIGVKSRLAIFDFQRFVNEYAEEPLSAILPGVALQQLWSVIGVGEVALAAVAAMVVIAALLGIATMLLATLNERRRELAILRAVGAGPATIFGLLISEAVAISVAGAVLGAGLHYLGFMIAQPWIDEAFGLYLPVEFPGLRELLFVALVGLSGALAGLPPAIRAYRLSLADGIAVRN